MGNGNSTNRNDAAGQGNGDGDGADSQFVVVKIPSWALVGVFVSLGCGYVFARQFIYNYRISKRLRDGQEKEVRRYRIVDIEEGQVGEYVIVQGVIKPKRGESPLVSPFGKMDCVMYRTTRLRVTEHIDTTTVTSEMSGSRKYTSKEASEVNTNPFRFLSGYVSKFTSRPNSQVGSKSTTQQSRGSHNLAYDRLASEENEIGWILEDAYGSYALVDTRTCVSDYFRLTKSFENFENLDPKSKQSSNVVRTVGFKTIEQVLKVGQRLLVLGEVGKVQIDEDGLKVVTLRAPRSHGFFDIRTARVKPYIVTTMDDEELIHKVEAQGRTQFLAASIFGAIAFLILVRGSGLITHERAR